MLALFGLELIFIMHIEEIVALMALTMLLVPLWKMMSKAQFVLL